jgi:hypothetical protein
MASASVATEANAFEIAVRFKPLPPGDDLGKAHAAPPAIDRRFTLLRAETSQEDVYEQVAAPIVQQVVDKKGGVGVFLCYGQTGSGKTHTIFGPPASLTESSITEPDVAPATWGLFGRAMAALLAAPDAFQSALSVSAVEIYLDRV